MKGPALGLSDRIRPGDDGRAERLLEHLRSVGASHVRIVVPMDDWDSPGGRAWYERLLASLASQAEVLPCFSSERPPGEFADLVGAAIDSLGGWFDHVELRSTERDGDRGGLRPWPEALRAAATRARELGKKAVLGGIDAVDARALGRLIESGALPCADVVGLRARAGPKGLWGDDLARARREVEASAPGLAIWITDAACSTWKFGEFRQLRALVDALDLPVGRVYWFPAQDPDPEGAAGEAPDGDERESHLGLWTAAGRPKLLARLWSRLGPDGVREAGRFPDGPRARTSRPVLITGGAGFIGTNLADRLLGEGRSVILYDSLSRAGAEDNLKWMREKHGTAGVEVVVSDVRDPGALSPLVRRASAIFHLAAQVAVTSSLEDPAHDFEVNAGGTFTLMNLVSGLADPPPLVFTSTNKVYGNLGDVPLVERDTRYEPEDPRLRGRGIGEDRPLEFHSPYGCSKGAADQYVLDFARTRSLPATVFRMSCIYGPHQCGNEDQGWVCHFVRRVLEGSPLTVYGDGKQVRDVLYVEDLAEAFLQVLRNPSAAAGRAFNLGGGPTNAISLLELLSILEGLHGSRPDVRFSEWRTADQRYFVADTGRFSSATGWAPRVPAADGIGRLYRWLKPQRAAGGTARWSSRWRKSS